MLRSGSFLLPWVLASALAIPSAASALSIDFEGFDHGDVFAGPTRTTADYTLIVERNDPAYGPGVIFDTGNVGSADPDLNFAGGWASGNIQGEDLGNLLIVQENASSCDALLCTEPNDARRGGSFTFLLEEEFQAFEFVLVDIDPDQQETVGSVRFFFREDGQPDVEVAAFAFDSFIGTQGIDFGDRSANRIDLGNVGGIFNAFEINLVSSGGIDDIRVKPVPEPSTAALFMLGLLSLVRSRRSRRTGTVPARS